MMPMEEPLPLTSLKPKPLTPSFGVLAQAVRVRTNLPYQFPLTWRRAQELKKNTMMTCQVWREEQFGHTMQKRREQLE